MTLLIAGSITRPHRVLDAATQALAQGELDAPLPQARGRDEIAHLTASFGQHARRPPAAHRRAARDHRGAGAHRERAAHRRVDPDEPRAAYVPARTRERRDLELIALLEPAREVGGDFYDFFLLDDDHLCLAIADVSGKGVPAALLMAVGRSFLRSFARESGSPVQVLGWLNEELAADNEDVHVRDHVPGRRRPPHRRRCATRAPATTGRS